MSDIIENIEYENIKKPSILTGMVLSKNSYKYDSNGNLIQPDPLINAVDIDWGGAKLDGLDNLSTTSQLLDYISNMHENGGSGSIPIIDENTMVGIMLSAIRALQAEVSKLRSSFIDGIYSCTGKETKISATNYSYHDIDAREPLWAIDESTLSEILSVNLTDSNSFDHSTDIEINVENNSLTFNNLTTWYDSENVIESVVNPNVSPKIVKQDTDVAIMPKIYVYLSSTGLDITFINNIKK